MQQTNTILLYNLPLLQRHRKGASLFLVNYRTTLKPANNITIFTITTGTRETEE